MRVIYLRLIGLPMVLGLLGCTHEVTSPPPFGFCSANFAFAVVIAVNDSITGASVADSARGVVQAGSYVDSLHLAYPPPVLVGGMQLGTYQVIVDRAGYHEWTRNGVLVSQRAGPCNTIQSVHLTALLQRTP
jgi:hypothetical protein